MSTTTPYPKPPPKPARARLLRGPVLATLLALAVPNIIVMLAQAAANFPRKLLCRPARRRRPGPARRLVFPLVMLMQMMSRRRHRRRHRLLHRAGPGRRTA